MIYAVDIEFNRFTDIFSGSLFPGMNTDAESPFPARFEIWFETPWRIPIFSSAHAESGNLIIPGSQLFQSLQRLLNRAGPHYRTHIKTGNTIPHIMNGTENTTHDCMKRRLFSLKDLRIEKKFRMNHSIGGSALKISTGQIVKILFRNKDFTAFIIDREKTGKITELKSFMQILWSFPRQRDMISSSKSEQHFRFESSFQMNMQIGLRHFYEIIPPS